MSMTTRFGIGVAVVVGVVTGGGALTSARAQEQPQPTAAVATPDLGLPPPSRSMTLEEALAFARKNNPYLRRETARVALGEERAREPRAAWEPRFGATLQGVGSSNNNSATNWLGSRGAVEFPRIAGTGFLQEPSEINWKPYMNTAAGVSGEQRLFDFGRVAAETVAAEAEVDVQRARFEDRRLSVDLAVREAFYVVLVARAIVDVARDAAARARLHRDDARARVLQGLRTRIELERAEADLARFEVSVLRAEGGLRSAQATFAAAVGVPLPALDVTGKPSLSESQSVPPIDAVLERAAQHDPSIRAAVLQTQASRKRVRAVEAQNRPEIWAIGTINGAAGGAPKENSTAQTWGRGVVPWVPDYFAGVVLAWRFWDPITNARAETARREEDVSTSEVPIVKQEIVAAVEQAWVSLDVAVRTLPSLERAVVAARANHQQAESRFQQGLGTSIELADAEALRTAAEIDSALGRFEAERARARLVRLTGGEN